MGVPQYDAGLVTAVSALVIVAALCFAVFRRVRSGAAPDPSSGDREIVVRLYETLMPTLPVVDGLRLSASFVPADAADAAGGDFYDAFFLDDETLAVAVGEAKGSGIAATLAMECVRNALRSALLEGARPVDALRRANAMLLRSETRATATATVGILDPATLQFRYACAGHAPPLMATGDGACAPLPGTDSGSGLGIVDHHINAEQTVNLPVGSLVALYTDGCTMLAGGPNAARSMLSYALSDARLLEPVKPAPAIDGAIFGTLPRVDDTTILTISPESTLAHINLHLPAEAGSAALARVALRRFFAATPLDERRAYDALVAAGEAISNAIEHAYDRQPGHTFSVRTVNEDDACLVLIEDTGRWRQGSGDGTRGHGISLMKELSDVCDIDRRRGGTRVTLRFRYNPNLADASLSIAG
jgi:anti-sigma regulatory factor (Ser/Thr protein kinase)